MPEQSLSMWVIYSHPSDYPGHYVVRRWVICREGLCAHNLPEYVGSCLEDARAAIPDGLCKINRSADDDPVIVETWL